MAKHILQEMLESAGYDCRSYSGRGMFGQTCLGVSCEIGELFQAILGEVNETNLDSLWSLQKTFREMKTDSMGRGTIVYFPDVEFSDNNSEEEDSDDL